MSGNDGRFETYYAKEDSGKVTFEERKDCLEDIQKYIDLIDNIKKSDDIGKTAGVALEEVRYQIESLKYTDIPAEEVKKKLNKYSRVPLGDGKFMHLSSFLASTGEQRVVKTEEEYIQQVKKMLDNTKSNLTNLLIFKEEDEHLKGFFEELQVIEKSTDYTDVKKRMDHLTMSGIIKHYNETKLDFLKKWLAPFEEKLGKPISEMSSKEMQEALGQVEGLKKKELEQVGIRINSETADHFRAYNKVGHELMNGDSTDFWGFPEQRDEFVELVKKIINRFSFKLENHYLVFESSDKKMAYLVGFSDDLFGKKKELSDNKVGLTPHLKVLIANKSGEFQELRKEDMEKPTEYYRVLKTAVVPFLASLSMMVDTPLSKEFKDAFDMWL
ncbi:MAG: hypothetical protein HQM14_11915 [SAR324 cluster bacterium]|nr:hypothetical protein [SAR324 cluster bacterium]